MACNTAILLRVPASAARDVNACDQHPRVFGGGMRRSCSARDALCNGRGMVRRSRSEPFLLLCTLKPPPAGSSTPEPKLKHGGSVGIFPYEYGEAKMVVLEEGNDVEGPHLPLHELGKGERANWVDRLLELGGSGRDASF